MSVFGVLSAAIYSTLSGGTALTGLLGGTAVYQDAAPDGANLPYVVFSLPAGGPRNIYPHDMREQVVFARGYAATSTQAGSIDAAVSSLLHKRALTVTGYTNYRTVRETDLALTEYPPDRTPVYMRGANYRVSLDD